MFEKYHGMSFRLRMVGLTLKILHWIFYPVFYLRQFWYKTRPLPRLRYPELQQLSATQLAEKIRNREVTSEQVVRAYFFRCRDVNPHLNAIVEDRFKEAIEEAHAVDEALLKGDKTKEELARDTPLLGVPLTIKGSIAVKGLSNAVGAFKLKGRKAEEDARVVQMLREAGAIILCITNTPELCTSWETVNYVTGRTLNPYSFARTPGGSSGGEAALISSAASVIGVGSDMAGSIRVPAMFTGIFGHKPTAGIVPVQGHFPLMDDEEFQRILVLGPLTRYAEDLSLMMKVMVEPHTAKLLNLDSPVSITDIKIYYKDNMGDNAIFILPMENEIKVAIKKAIHYLRSQCVFAEELNWPELALSPEACMGKVFSIENLKTIYSIIEPLSHNKTQPNTLLEILKSLFGLSAYTPHALLFQSYMENNGFLSESQLESNKQLLESFRDKFKELLDTTGVFIYPSYPTQAPLHGEILVSSSGAYYPMLANIFGFPATSVPLGLGTNGLPVGLQVMAGPNQDRLCLAVAKKLEAVFYGWTLPNSTGLLVEHRE
uniref:Fatty-acid amide hydrolase 2 n=1 Tax=Cacopsylla melanoneura TaxID=428564 RepID=A0A8D9AG24_9HEMI